MFIKNSRKKAILVGNDFLCIHLAKNLSLKFDLIFFTENKNINYDQFNDSDFILEELDNNLIQILDNYYDENVEYFLSLTNCDKNNIYNCWIAKNFGITKSYAGIYDDYNFQFDKSSLAIINLNYPLFDYIVQSLTKKVSLNLDDFENVELYFRNKKASRKNILTDKKISKISKDKITGLVYIKRDNKFLLPLSDEIIRENDILYYLEQDNAAKNNFFKFNHMMNKIIVYADKNYSTILYKKLNNYFRNFVIINDDFKQCEELANNFNDVLILNGEGDDIELLNNIGINKDTVFVAATLSDYKNLLSSYTINKLNCNNIYTFINNKKQLHHAKLLDIEKIIYFPELLASYVENSIFLYKNIYEKTIEKNISFCLIKIDKKNKFLNKKTEDININFKNGIILVAILRENKLIYSSTNPKIKLNDYIIFVYYKNKRYYLFSNFN